jgi:hypothetical protein
MEALDDLWLLTRQEQLGVHQEINDLRGKKTVWTAVMWSTPKAEQEATCASEFGGLAMTSCKMGPHPSDNCNQNNCDEIIYVGFFCAMQGQAIEVY